MNQNTQDQMQSQQQIQQIQQMSQEELQKTQVLNLKDVEETARYEKVTSKKPAIIIAIIGVLSIFFGTTFGVVQSLTKDTTEEKQTTSTEKREVITEETLNCTLTQLNNTDGTDQIFNIIYTFTDDKLTNFVKTSAITPTIGSAIGANTIESFKQGMQAYLITLDGYLITLAPSGDGVVVTTTVDYSKLDLATFPESQQTLTYTRVDYIAGTDKTSIQADMISKGYSCQ